MVSLDKANPQNQKRVILGIVIIALGVMALFANVLSGLHLLEFWPVMFIVVGCVKLSQSEGGKGSSIGIVFIVLGGLMTLSNLGLFRMTDIWPLFLIGAGILLLMNSPPAMLANLTRANANQNADVGDHINSISIFGGSETKVVSPTFQGGEVMAIFGGSTVDCRSASIEGRAVIQVFSMFGGVEFKVPADWSVVNNTSAIMGGVDDSTVAPKESGKCLVIEGFVALGGIEIKN